MFEITPENAIEYLRETRRVPSRRAVEVRALGWGVSNVVLRVNVAGEPSFVLKQAREKLRVKADWFSRLERIWTERESLILLDGILPVGTVPRVLFSDEANYLFAMTCAADDSMVWKEQLLAGEVDPEVGRKAGEILGMIHRDTRDHPSLQGRLSDLTAFDELRIDPFYREIARVHPEIAAVIDTLIASMREVEHPCMVLGDFSPKNILVHSKGLTLVDFETAHAGDPAFDVGFFMSHLMLKKHRRGSQNRHAGAANRECLGPEPRFDGLMDAFKLAYRSTLGSSLDRDRSERHGVACVLARIDGKSPVDYLDEEAGRTLRETFLKTLTESHAG